MNTTHVYLRTLEYPKLTSSLPQVIYGDYYWRLINSKELTWFDIIQLPVLEAISYLAVKFLQWRGTLEYSKDQVNYYKTPVSIKETRIDVTDIVKATMEHITEVHRTTRKKPTKLYLGREFYDRQLNEVWMNPIRFTIPHGYSSNPLDIMSYYYGLEVIFLPYFEGMLAITEEFMAPQGN